MSPDMDVSGGLETRPIDRADSANVAVHTFLIADLRGYTRFTQERGDEAAARLALDFATLVRTGVEARGGRLVELRGDEALVVFSSARQALRTAVALQDAFRKESLREPSTPLVAGIGLDSGEAVPVAGGFRGAALNLAARLCSLAAPGEVLASDVVVHLGRRIEGIEYLEREPEKLKGFAEPIRIVQVVASGRPDGVPDTLQEETALTIPLPIGGFLGAAPEGALVARRDEIDQALRVIGAVQGGAGRLLLFTGEPGIGKTRLAQEVMMMVRERGFLVSAGSCSEPRQMVAFYPFLDALSALYRSSPSWLRQEVKGSSPSLGHILPDIGTPAAEPHANGQEEHVRLLRAIAGFLRSLANIAPVAIMLDDLQWADMASIDLIEHLVHSTRDHRVLLAGTLRDVEVDKQHPLSRVLFDLEGQSLLDSIAVRRLDIEGTTALLTTRVGESVPTAELAEIVYQKTEGNPFFVREVAHVLREKGAHAGSLTDVPERLRGAINQRVDRLEEPASTLLREASVLGPEFRFDVVRAVSGRGEDEVDTALERAVQAGLLRREGDDLYFFEHALTQAALYAQLTPRRRKRLHLAAARALETRVEPRVSDEDDGGRGAEMAWHYLKAEDAEHGIPYAVTAANRALQLFAYGEAERLYRAAIELAREQGIGITSELPRKLGEVLKIIGRYDEALESLEQAAGTASDAGDREEERWSVAEAADVLGAQGKPRAGIDRLQPLFEMPVSATDGWILVHLALAGLLALGREHEESLRAAETAARLASETGNMELLARADVRRAEALALGGRFAEARTVLNAVVPQLEQQSLVDALNASGHLRQHAGQLEQSRSDHARALEIATELRDANAVTTSLILLSAVQFRLGKWREARSGVQEAIGREREAGAGQAADLLRAYLAPLDIEEGRWEEAEKNLENAVEMSRRDRDPALFDFAARNLGELELLRGRPSAAKSWIEKIRTPIDPWHRGDYLLLLARILLAEDQIAPAEARTVEAVASATALHDRPAFARALLLRGSIRARQGQWTEAGRLFESALTLARGMSYPFLEALVLQERGVMERTRGSTTAETYLRDARAILQSLGARPRLALLDSVLADATGRSPGL